MNCSLLVVWIVGDTKIATPAEKENERKRRKTGLVLIIVVGQFC